MFFDRRDIREAPQIAGIASGRFTQHSEQDMKTILRFIRYHYAMWRHQRKFGKFPPLGF